MISEAQPPDGPHPHEPSRAEPAAGEAVKAGLGEDPPALEQHPPDAGEPAAAGHEYDTEEHPPHTGGEPAGDVHPDAEELPAYVAGKVHSDAEGLTAADVHPGAEELPAGAADPRAQELPQPRPPAPSPRAAPRRARPARGKGRRPGLTPSRVGALVALAVAAFAVWFLISLFQPFAAGGSRSVIVDIPKGSSASKIGTILARDGVVSSAFFFDVRALVEGKRGDLHSGRYRLKRDMSYSAAIAALSKPPPAAILVSVLIPEGFTRMQVAELAREDALSGSYLQASKRSTALKPTDYGAPSGTPNLEGFLFPATYDLTAGVPAARLVSEQLIAFRQRFGPVEVRRAHELGVTPYQLLTVASMVEREAQTTHDRPLIAAVIYNRLRQGMALGIDATIYYAVELAKGIATYTHELTTAQLNIDSPYNTRTHRGLPPTPISNPGVASITAAAHPAQVPYLYYVAAADGCGEQAFSTTYAQFQTNVAAYQAAVAKNGGHPPTCKKK